MKRNYTNRNNLNDILELSLCKLGTDDITTCKNEDQNTK